MFSRLQNRLGTAGLVVAVVALIAALAGTAFAATKLNGTQKKEVEKIAKKFAGKNGTNGTNGAPGANGKDGANGTNGSAGQSVTTAAASGAECATGGVKLTAASGTSKVCNGEDGLQGLPGSPWTAGGTLPKGSTETGSWGATFALEGVAPITFPIPLAAALVGTKVKIVPEGAAPGSKAECDNETGPGGSVANPEADEGFLCVFVGAFEGTNTAIAAVVSPATVAAGASTSGAEVLLGTETTGLAVGTFAVTAP